MAFEWIKLETNLLKDPRILRMIDEKGLCMLGAYTLLRLIIDSQGDKGVNQNYLEHAITDINRRFYPTCKKVLTDYGLFSYDDLFMIHSVSTEPLTLAGVTYDANAQGVTTDANAHGVTPESSLRDNSLEKDNLENLERERGRHTSPAVGRSSSRPKFFIPPTIEEVEAYCKEKGYHIDAEQFVMYYEQKGWKVKGDKMTKWKAAVSTWVLRDKHSAKHDPANRRERDIPDASYIKPYTGYLPPNAPPRPTPTAVWSISVDAWVEPYGPNRLKPIVGMDSANRFR